MELSLIALSVTNFAYVCLLPFIFFKNEGTFNLMWCLTAWPYVAFPAILISGHLGLVEPMFAIASSGVATVLVTLASAFSIGLIAATMSVHRVPLALWHQENDAPASIVTFGPYGKVRHPFYTAFIICLTSGFVIFPHPATLAITLYGYAILFLTAKKEEGKLSLSEFGEEYKSYMGKTGRFFPKLF